MKKLFTLSDMRRFLLIFYSVGLIGFIIPYTYPIFQHLIPLAILLNVYLLLVNHEGLTLKEIMVFVFILLGGFFIEAIGVQTGFPFGMYEYGSIMGPRIFNTPLIIGLNWLMLAYGAYYFSDKLPIPQWLKPLAGSILMVLYDILLEPMAIKLEMWNWTEIKVPIQNYISWFIISLAFLIVMAIVKIRIRNGIVMHVILLQSGLFGLLLLFFQIFKV